MGKGKSIYSGNVLGNRSGRELGEKKGASGKTSPMYKANKQNKEHQIEQGVGLQSLQVDFQTEYC